MISKARLKYLKSLQLKKYRKEEQSFVVEGGKGVAELMASDFKIEFVLATQAFYDANEKLFDSTGVDAQACTEEELSAAGSLQSNNAAIAVAKMKAEKMPDAGAGAWVLALDDIRDPGNLGTIIRTADWFGITNIVASQETADFYNAKTISASMGSFTRVNVFYCDLGEWLKAQKTTRYGAFLDGKNIHNIIFPDGGIIVVGNEANGISKDVEKCLDEHITIPRFGQAESLNAGLSTAIILDNLRRLQK